MGGVPQRVSPHRWTSALGRYRARTIEKLLLVIGAEWRLHEQLRTARVEFDLAAESVQGLGYRDPAGRVRLKIGPAVGRCEDAGGFRVEDGANRACFPSAEDVVEHLRFFDPQVS